MISLSDAGKQFSARGKTLRALEPLTLDVARQEFIALVGPSGCGKSTILNLIAGLLRPSEGTVKYDGVVVTRPNVRVGYITQKDTLLPWRNVQDNVGLALELKIRRTSRAAAAARVAAMIDLVGLKGFERHYPGELSGGMRKRAALARTLIYEPETLLMDEPFGALDAQTREVMHGLILHIVALERPTIVFVTHDVEEAVYLADRVIVLAPGPGRIDSVWPIELPPALERTQDLKRSPAFLAAAGEILDRIRATSGLQSDLDALRRLTGHAMRAVTAVM
jgi:NitT/TauT family transport system ATP-binding protein